jgi:tetratricopeptide (TPR) repeat protein
MKSKASNASRARKSTQTRSEPAKTSSPRLRDARVVPESSRWRVTVAIAAGLAATSILAYANSLANGFVFDDLDLVVDNRIIRSIENIPRILARSYRPVRDVSYALDYAIWGANPLGFHLTNVLIHAANVILVFLLMMRVTGTRLAAAIAAFVFAVHPIQTDAVSYVSGRRDVLFATFYLASFYSYLESRRRKSRVLFALFLILWGLSLLTKEMAASLPLVIFAWSFCEELRDRRPVKWNSLVRSGAAAVRRDWLLYSLCAAAVAGYVFLMVFLRRASVRAVPGSFDYWGGGFFDNLLTMSRVHVWYLKQLIVPTPIAQYFGAFEISTSIFDWRVIGSLVLLGATVAAGFYALRWSWLITFAMLAYFAMLLPVSHLIPHHELLADHYLYLPMVCLGLVAGLAVQTASRRSFRIKAVAYSAAALLLVAASVMTVLRNRDWKDEMSVWSANYRAVPNSPRAAFNLAAEYLKRNPRRAEELFKRALELDPAFAPTYSQLAQLLMSQNRLAECDLVVTRGLSLSDDEVRSFITMRPARFRSQLTTALGALRGKQGKEKEGEDLLWEAIRLDPANSEPYVLLALLYHNKNRAKEIEVLTRSVAANPFVYTVLERLVLVLVNERRYDEAIPFLDQMLRLSPNDFVAHYELGQIYRARNECERSRTHLNAARAAANSPEELQTVGDAFRQWEQACGNR